MKEVERMKKQETVDKIKEVIKAVGYALGGNLM